MPSFKLEKNITIVSKHHCAGDEEFVVPLCLFHPASHVGKQTMISLSDSVDDCPDQFL